MYEPESIRPGQWKKSGERKCKNCNSLKVWDINGEWVCCDCGRALARCVEGELTTLLSLGDYHESLKGSTKYQRKFYFHERCARWTCTEPLIPKDIKRLILKKSREKRWKDRIQIRCSRKNISKLLHEVDLPRKLCKKYRSRTTGAYLTRKRFVDQNIEKWKSIQLLITGIQPLLPSHHLVDAVKRIFYACQYPFDEVIKHGKKCDGKAKCYERQLQTGCRHNFPNINCFMRFALQMCELRYGIKDAFWLFQNEFPAISQKSMINKVRPFVINICQYNGWPVPICV